MNRNVSFKLFILCFLGLLGASESEAQKRIVCAPGKVTRGCSCSAEVTNPRRVVEYADQARYFALEDIRKASKYIDKRSRTYKVFQSLFSRLSNAEVRAGNLSECVINAAAFTIDGSNSIFVCPQKCNMYFDPDGWKARKVIIHEAAHLIGIKEECEAEWWADLVQSYVYYQRGINRKKWICRYGEMSARIWENSHQSQITVSKILAQLNL